MVQQDLKVRWVLLELKDLREIKAPRVLKVQRALLELRDLKVTQVPQE